jgi:tRNA modification GTPase
MFSTRDTIVAIATPGGRAGLGIVRLSGPAAHAIACALIARETSLVPRHAMVARLRAVEDVRDQVVVTYFAGPHSYTTEDVVEIGAHGSPVVLQRIVQSALSLGARLARPGEFTFRAFINGRIDLTQAEAVADLIEAVTPRQARAASDQLDGRLATEIRRLESLLFDLAARLEASLDFPDEGYHFVEPDEARAELVRIQGDVDGLLDDARTGQLVRDGVRVVIAGRPNVGKSSLLNRVVGSDRAIVATQPGTTRDVIAETLDVNGVPVTLVDTAGVRDALDDAEREGVRRALDAAGAADLILLVLDLSTPLTIEDQRLLALTAGRTRVVAANKSDRVRAWDPADLGSGAWCAVSSLTGQGVPELMSLVASTIGASVETSDSPRITNERHVHLLRRCSAALARAIEESARRDGGAPEEVLLFEMADARAALEEVAGRRTREDVLARIFERFCIGK